MDKFAKIDAVFLTAGTTYGIANISDVLGIIVLSLQVVWLATKIIVKVVRHIKEGKELAEIDDEVDGLIDLITTKKEEADDGDRTDDEE